MSQVAENKVMDALEGMRKDLASLKQDVHDIKEYMEDSRLTEDERKSLDESIRKIRSGDKSDFVSMEDLGKELGV